MINIDNSFLSRHSGSMKITGSQLRAARAFLGWAQADLARAADVGLSTIQKVEEVDGDPRVTSTLQWRSDARDEALVKIRGALEKAGITFMAPSAQSVGLLGRLKG
jgi:DNA-binding XRE family transcriptional regulator